LIDEDAIGLYAQDAVDLLPNLTLTGAVRYDTTTYEFTDELNSANNGNRRFSQVTPRVGLAYAPWRVLTVYANYGEGFRAPTTDELFAFGVGSSNPDLQPVKSRTYELGLRARPLSWVEGSAAVFLTDTRDEIVFDSSIPPFGRNANSPKSRRQGIELGTHLRPHDRVDLQFNYTYTDARYRSEATLFTGTIHPGDRVALVPMHRLFGSVTARPLDGLEIALDGQYVGKQVLLNNEANVTTFRVQDAFVLNARASYTWKWCTLFLQGNNLTDARNETYGILSGGLVYLMPAPGINVLGGVRIRFENYH